MMEHVKKWLAVVWALCTVTMGLQVPAAAKETINASLTVLYGLGQGSLIIEHDGKKEELASQEEQKVYRLEGKEGDEIKIYAQKQSDDLLHRLTVYERGGEKQEFVERPSEEAEAVFTMKGDLVAEVVYADPDAYNSLMTMGPACTQGAYAQEGHAGMASFALTQLGTPYIWNTQGFGSYDCSGLVSRAAWAINWMDGWRIGSSADGWNSFLLGQNIPHEDIDLSAGFDPAAHPTKKGDIVVFMKEGFGKAVHIAIMLDQDNMIGAINGQGQYAGVSRALPLSQWYVNSGLLKKDSKCARIFHFDTGQDTTVRVQKRSSVPSVTDGNNSYSLAGAEYTIYKERECKTPLTMIKVDAAGNGTSGVFRLPSKAKTELYARETKAPDNGSYHLDARVIPFTVENGTGYFTAQDVPVNDPMNFQVVKVSEDDHVISDPASMEGAQFTLRYYKGQYRNKEELKGKKPERTWVLETKKNSSGKYIASLDEAHKVSGDAFYHSNQGNVILYLGTLTVEETKAPQGYTLEGSVMVQSNGHSETLQERDGPMIFQIRNDQDGVHLHTAVGMRLDDPELIKKEKQIRGSLRLQKKDSELGAVCQGGAGGLTAGFMVHNDNAYDVVMKNDAGEILGKAKAGQDFDYVIHTDQSGRYTSPKQFLPVGSYTLRETEPPKGYLGTEQRYTFQIQEGRTEIVCLDTFANAIKRGGFRVQKYDCLTGTRPQGDTDLKMSFKVLSNNDHPVKVGGQTYQKGDVVFSASTNEKGFYESALDLLPYGSYTLEEVTPPVGYNKSGRTSAVFQINEDHTYADLTHGEIADDVMRGSLRLHKVITDDKPTNWVDNEYGAVFGVVKTAYVKKYGSVQKALAHQYDVEPEKMLDNYWVTKNLFCGKQTVDTINKDGADPDLMTGYEYAMIRTGETGIAYTGENALAYGSYTVAQLSALNDTVNFDHTPVTIDIFKDGVEITLEAANTKKKYRLALVKMDALLNKPVTLHSATFRIFQLKDEYGRWKIRRVKQKVGSKVYDTFRTASMHGHEKLKPGTFYAGEEADGSVVLPLLLEPGVYRIEEMEAPEGYMQMKPVDVTISSKNITEVDEDGDPYVVVKVDNRRRYGKLILDKYIEDIYADTDLLPDDILSQIEFTLTAAEDIVDLLDGSIITKKGEPARDIYGHIIGVFHPDEHGHVELTHLPLGKYELRETYVPEGLVCNTEVLHIDMRGLKGKQEETIEEFKLKNVPTVIELSKKAITGEDELPGAQIEIIEQVSGEVVDRYVSGKKPHIIKGLKREHTYIMKEVCTPEDGSYVQADEITFTVASDGSTKPVTMYNAQTSLRKSDASGAFVEGAEIVVLDKDGNTVDQWVSDGKTAHVIHHLKAGQTYTVKETKVPAGYVKFKDIVFTADGKHDVEIKAVDVKETVEKLDEDGNHVKGAHLEVKDTAGNVIDQWDTGRHIVDLAEHRKELKKNGKVQWKMEDGTYYDVVEKEETYEVLITYPDGHRERGLVDDQGDEIKHYVSGLVSGNTYTIHEAETPQGYYYAKDLMLMPLSRQDSSHRLVDERVRYKLAKVDEEGNMVEGVKMKLEDITDPDHIKQIPLPHDGLSQKEPFILDGVLQAGHTYRFTELAVTEGFAKPQEAEMEFVVPKYGSAEWTWIRFVNLHNHVSIMKVDERGDALAGAQMAVLEAEIDPITKEVKDGKVVHQYVSQQGSEDISAYVKGDGTPYILREVQAPFGYQKIDDMLFTIQPEEAGKVKVLTAIDVHAPIRVRVHKVDREDHRKALAGAEFTLYDKNGKVVKTRDGKDAVGVSDANGNVLWDVQYAEGMYVRETKAPDGYQLNSRNHPIVVEDPSVFEGEGIVEVLIEDEKDTKTGVATGTIVPLGAAVMTMTAVCLLAVRRRMDA